MMFILFDCTVPSGAPENVTAEAMSSTRMLVTWGPVPEPQQNGNILGYKVLSEFMKLEARFQDLYLKDIGRASKKKILYTCGPEKYCINVFHLVMA